MLGIMLKNTPKMVFFGFCKKFSSLMCRFFGIKRCSIIVFTILRKPHVWEKSGSRVMLKNALGQSDCRIFKLEYLLNYMRYELDFLCVGRYSLLLKIDPAVIAWQVQAWLWAWPGILGHAQSVLK